MSKLLLLYGYNNYFNRIIKRQQNLASYRQEVGTGYYVEMNNVNFNVTDGVNARHVFNVSSFLDGKSPDYLVREITKDGTTKLERWFVLESVKIMGNQIQLSLRRDVIADYYDKIIEAPCFIQKGFVHENSPLIFNKEGMTFNEIKTKEILLKDSTKCAWVVGYLARKLDGEEHDPVIGKTEIESSSSSVIDYEDLPEKIKSIITAGTTKQVNKIDFSFLVRPAMGAYDRLVTITEDNNSQTNITLSSGQGVTGLLPPLSTNIQYDQINPSVFLEAYDWINLKGFIENNLRTITKTLYDQYNNQIIKRTVSGVEKNYRISFTKSSESNETYTANKDNLLNTGFGLQVCNEYLNYITNTYSAYQRTNPSATTNLFKAIATLDNYLVSLVEEDLSDVTATISNNRNSLYDAPYDMFAIPLGDNISVKKNNSTFNVASNVALPIARGIKLEFGSECYDIQILPFCPFKDILNPNHPQQILLDDFTEGKDYALIKNESEQNVSIIIFPHRSSGNYDVDVSNIVELQLKSTSLLKKVESETIKARLVSPNYSGSFDFNPQKNNGVPKINIDYNCKPYSPYIHVSPIFRGLYGIDTNDARGLICGGDFSISTAASQWEEYQIQNKNFENIFDRQIQNMDVNNSIAMEKAKYTATLGAISAGVQGATGGAIAGSAAGPWGIAIGAVAGGTIGAVSSAVAGVKDVELLGKQQSENRDYAVDMYTYQLGNIQALPYTLTKVSTYNENNKIFPFIEIYDCTEVEKQNLRDKIKYNGMTVMVQGKISDYLEDRYLESRFSYIQAQLIRLEGIYEDNHLITEIYNELMKGVYL